MKRRIYIARKILPDPTSETVLDITSGLGVEEIKLLYVNREIERDTFIHNGHWVLRPINAEGALIKTTLPFSLTPRDVFEMVEAKISSSDALIAILGPKSFGAIVELGYAIGRGDVAVYVLPEKDLEREMVKDLWLSFQFALRTRRLWKQSDIESVEEFKMYGIHTVENYENFILNIIPPFLENK